MPNHGKYSYRHAEENDLLDIAFLGKKFVKESKNQNLGWDQEKVLNTTLEAIERNDFIVLVLEKGDEIVGFFAGFHTPCFFSNETQIVELAWYVLPDHRKSKKAIEMLKEYENWGKEKGAVQANMINLDVLNEDKLRKFYEKRGYRLTENTFSKELT